MSSTTGYKQHTCWDDPQWDGLMKAQGRCAGCDEAAQHPCRYCGYGHVFATHNDLAHAENGDPDVPEIPDDTWICAPRLDDGEPVAVSGHQRPPEDGIIVETTCKEQP